MRGNIIKAVYNDTGRYKTAPLYQYDYGQILQIEGAELPAAYEVHFSTTLHGEAVIQIGNSSGVLIPDMFLQTDYTLYAWLYLHTGDDDGETEFAITIPVNYRAAPENIEPTPVQQNAIDQAITACNTAAAAASDHKMGDYRIVRKTPASSYPVIEGLPPARILLTWNGTYQLIDKYGKVIDEFTNNSALQPTSITSQSFVAAVYWDTTGKAQGKIKIASTYTADVNNYPLGWIDMMDLTAPGTWFTIKYSVST